MSKRRWTKKEIEILKERYPDECSEDIALDLNRTVSSVYLKARDIGVKKSIEFKRRYAKRLNLHPNSLNNRFVKGSIPHNKGKKLQEYLTHEQITKVKKTQFKKGRLPHNISENGVIRVRHEKNGIPYNYIRISKRHWELLHRKLWEQKYGTYNASKYCLRCKTDDTTNSNPDNWELVKRSENLRRNENQLPPDIMQLKKLNTRLKNAIKKVS